MNLSEVEISQRQYFKEIRHRCGKSAVNQMKQYSRTLNSISTITNRKIFLHKCKTNQVVPKFLQFNLKHINFVNPKFRDQFAKKIKQLQFQIINLIIGDSIPKTILELMLQRELKHTKRQ